MTSIGAGLYPAGAVLALLIGTATASHAQRACSTATVTGTSEAPATFAPSRQAVSAGRQKGAAMVTGGGIAVLTDTDGETFRHQFSISAMVDSDGLARGHARFSFSRAFSLKWGAVPGVSEILHLVGEIVSGSTASDGSVTLSGPFIETDFASGEGMIFTEDSRVTGVAPLTLKISPQADTFSLTWCAFIPPNGMGSFSVSVEKGNLTIHRPKQ